MLLVLADVAVTNAAELRDAVENAAPGDVITLAAGDYDITGNLLADTVGTASDPVVVRADELGTARIRFDAVEGFHVTGPYWTFENLDIEGVCATDDACEHAFHITGAADGVVVRGCRLHEFNAMIKGNGDTVGPGGERVWPDDVVIERTEFFSSAPRQTANPVTPIDIVGGRRWVIRGNFIHDHAKGGGDGVSYAAFLKGNSKDGVIEQNLVVCELLHTGQTRLGLSFGGGGTGPDSICEEGTCTPEHEGGVMRNNVIRACPADVGIYLNEAADVRILHNTLLDTTGIDARFAATVADVRGNLLSTGLIRDREGGTTTRADNVEGFDATAVFVDPAGGDLALLDGALLVDLGTADPDVTVDFCGNARDDGAPDLGAYEYDGDGCDSAGVADAGPQDDAGGGGMGEDDGGGCCDAGHGPGSGALAVALLALLGRRGRRMAR